MTLRRRTVWLLIALPVLAYLFAFVLPLGTAGRMSLNEFSRLQGVHPATTLAHYREVVSDPFFRNTWMTTIWIATQVAVITTVLAGSVSYLMWRRGGRLRGYLTMLVLAPLFVSGVVRAYGWIPVTGPAGLLPQLTSALGLGEITMMFSRHAVVLALVHIMLPFAVITILAALDTIDESIIKASRNLGAKSSQTIRKVVIPLARQGLVSAFLLVFAISSAAYSIPAIVGGRRVNMVSIEIFTQQTGTRNWPLAAALSVSLILVTIVVLTVVGRIAGTSKAIPSTRSDR